MSFLCSYCRWLLLKCSTIGTGFNGAETNCGIVHILGILLMKSYDIYPWIFRATTICRVPFEWQGKKSEIRYLRVLNVFTAETMICPPQLGIMNFIKRIVLTLYSDEHITDSNANTIISSASVTSLIVPADGHRKGYVTVTRESCPRDIYRWITISCTVKHHLFSHIYCLIMRYVCDFRRA